MTVDFTLNTQFKNRISTINTFCGNGLLKLECTGRTMYLTGQSDNFILIRSSYTLPEEDILKANDFKIIVNLKLFSSAVSQFDEGSAITFKDNVCTIKKEKKVIKIPVDSEKSVQFAEWSENLGTSAIKLNKRLIEAISAVKYACVKMSLADSNPAKKAINVKVEKNICTVSALDGFRCAVGVFLVDQDTPAVEMMIPIDVVERFLKIPSCEAEILRENDNCFIKLDKYMIKFSPIISNFFDATIFYKTAPNLSVRMSKEKLNSFIKAVKMFQGQKVRPSINMDFNLKEKTLKLSFNSSVGHVENVIPIEYATKNKDVELFQTGYSLLFLENLLNQIKGDTIQFDYTEPLAPVIIRQEENEANYAHILLPIRRTDIKKTEIKEKAA